MNKTPSALKWLAEKRARIANDVLQTERLVRELSERHRTLQHQLKTIDETIQLYDAKLDPTTISPVNAWQGRYGRRGALKEAVMNGIRKAAPDWVATNNLAATVAAEFGLSFGSPRLYRKWVHDTLVCALKRMDAEGTVERLRDPLAHANEEAYWRLAQSAPARLADL